VDCANETTGGSSGGDGLAGVVLGGSPILDGNCVAGVGDVDCQNSTNGGNSDSDGGIAGGSPIANGNTVAGIGNDCENQTAVVTMTATAFAFPNRRGLRGQTSGGNGDCDGVAAVTPIASSNCVAGVGVALPTTRRAAKAP
jgi:hypothetical protein